MRGNVLRHFSSRFLIFFLSVLLLEKSNTFKGFLKKGDINIDIVLMMIDRISFRLIIECLKIALRLPQDYYHRKVWKMLVNLHPLPHFPFL